MSYIDFDNWKKLDPETDVLKDATGRIWTVLSNLGEQTPGYALEVVCPGHMSEILHMREMMDGHYYVFGCDGLLVELNQSTSAIVPIDNQFNFF